jgi:hypothetical protein
MPAAVSSAAGLLTLLDEPSDELQKHALTKLNGLVHDFWFEVGTACRLPRLQRGHIARTAPAAPAPAAAPRGPRAAKPHATDRHACCAPVPTDLALDRLR